jgi:hypothetical protein
MVHRRLLIILGIFLVLFLAVLFIGIELLPGPYGMISVYEVNESDTNNAKIIPLTENDLRIFPELGEILRGESVTVSLNQEDYSKYRDICDFYYSARNIRTPM